jgi:hypothetical protein
MRRYLLFAASAVLLVGTAASATWARSESAPGKEITARDFSRQRFDRSTRIDNRWLPMRPGTQLLYEGSSLEGGKRVRHRVVFTVTDLTKVVNGVRSVVLWERDYTSGRLAETELAFFAQDNDGNVWHLGQYPEVYEDGKLVEVPAWISPFKGSRPGITMKARPRLGAPAYSQGFAPPPVNWVDHAEVYRMSAKTCVPFDCFTGVLVTREFEPDKPGASQLKYYAPGVGNVRVGWLGAKDEAKEVLVLVKVLHLRPAAMAQVRADALKLEKRAYRISKNVYGRTPPAKTRT